MLSYISLMFFISCRKCQDTLQLNTCVKYCTKDQRNAMSEMLEMVFTAFMPHCMQSIDFMSEMSKILCIQWPLTLPGGKACCSHTVHPVGLAVHHHAVQGGSFVLKHSGTSQTKRVIAGKMHSQSPILNAMRVLSNPVILTNL